MTRNRGRGEGSEPAAANQMTALERRARRLLLVYPAAHRRDRGEEIIGTLLEATPDDLAWPRLRDARALAISGFKARAAQNGQRTTKANLRIAITAGLALYVSLLVAQYLDGIVQGFMPTFEMASSWTGWPAAVTALLLSATVVVAWTAPRYVVMVAVLAASAAVIGFALAPGNPFAMLPPRIVQVMGLAGLAALTPWTRRPSRHWLWLAGVLAISPPLAWLGAANGWFGLDNSFHEVSRLALLTFAVPLLIVVACGIIWLAIDARLIGAVLTCLAVYGLQVSVTGISFGLSRVALGSLPFLGVVLALAPPAAWLLRRQSARPVR